MIRNNNRFLLLLLIIFIPVYVALGYMLKAYDSINLASHYENKVLYVAFTAAVIGYPFTLWRYFKRRYGEYLRKSGDAYPPKGAFVAFLSMLLMTLLYFFPLLLVASPPYDKSRYIAYDLQVQGKYKSRSGGSAPTYTLETTSWRDKRSEHFSAKYDFTKQYTKGDELHVKIAQDIFGNDRVVLIEKR